MKQNEQNWSNWEFKITINCQGKQLSAYFLACGLYFSIPAIAVAQSNIVPDTSLGSDSSIVTPNFDGLPQELITGGAQRGQNLFHSFQEFNILEGKSAYFANPEAVTNIFSRVTGNNISELFGTLGVAGTANLYFMNPNGIIFGQNASLDVSGSFVGTTANSIQFGEQSFYSATEPDAPPLLTVNPSAFFFNQIGAGDIVSNSVAPAGSFPNGFAPSGFADLFGLRVPDGENFILLGGNIEINNGSLIALDGNVELGSVSGEGIVELNRSSKKLNFGFSDDISRGSVVIQNDGGIENGGATGGTISIFAENIDILQGGSVGTGIVSGFGSTDTQAGDVILNATENIIITGIGNLGFSRVGSIIQSGATGNAGNVEVTAKNFALGNGAQLVSGTFGRGNGGNIDIEVDTFQITDTIIIDPEIGAVFPTRIFSGVFLSGEGNGGNIKIKANDVSLTNGGQISAGIFGRGNGGVVDIEATKISLDGAAANIVSGIFSSIDPGGFGIPGNIEIATEELSISDGSQISTTIFGQSEVGTGNQIEIEAESILIDGVNANGAFSGVFSLVQEAGIGDGGTIVINSDELTLTNQGQINVGTFGQGNAGTITINTTNNFSLDNSSVNSFGIFDDAGEIVIRGQNISLSNDSEISSNVQTSGNAGIINLIADETITSNDSNVVANVGNDESPATGNVGEIRLEADNIQFSNTAQIKAGLSTQAQGDAGNVSLTARESIVFTGTNTRIATNNAPDSIGKASDIFLTAPDITLINRAGLLAANQGDGSGGNISITGNNLTLSNDGFISSAVAFGTGGEITLQLTEDLTLRDSSTITARAFNDSTGGNLDIDSRFIIAFPGNNDIIADARQGQGGIIDITAESIFNMEERASFPPNTTNDIDASSQTEGLDGIVSIETLDVDPTRGLDNLPSNIVDASRLITRNCLATADEGELNEFVITGKGGFPANPENAISVDATLSAEWLTLTETEQPFVALTESENLPAKAIKQEIIEATAWTFDRQGKLILVADTSQSELKIPWLPNHSCSG